MRTLENFTDKVIALCYLQLTPLPDFIINGAASDVFSVAGGIQMSMKADIRHA
ncbi:Hypothetical protein OINT_2000191 [Brucella intermedia LMG 3301]|uniref:Uncharacterized protein n=1 Tax=Brucella intermedia LMG 3301 TaxID=641118 RepID=C4WM61_9HYPH|nr:Hypothetical protein OINT_2000191 [Brucella intermedia LMG 3301]ERI12276.1 hypothetical protein O206_14585 [Ochrobactrum sp. EGD-AQ16]